MKTESKFDYRDRVIIDGDKDLVALVTGFFFREGEHLVEISWFCDGKLNYDKIEHWRLEKA